MTSESFQLSCSDGGRNDLKKGVKVVRAVAALEFNTVHYLINHYKDEIRSSLSRATIYPL